MSEERVLYNGTNGAAVKHDHFGLSVQFQGTKNLLNLGHVGKKDAFLNTNGKDACILLLAQASQGEWRTALACG